MAKYDPELEWGNFETTEFCKTKRTVLLDTLSSSEDHDSRPTRAKPESNRFSIAKRIRRCKRGARCGLSICPLCMRQFRRWVVSQGLKILEQFPKIYFVTWVPEPHPFGPPPDRWDVLRMKEAFIKRLKRKVNIDAVAIGYVDVSIKKRFDCLSPHLHMLVANVTEAEINKLRKEKWPELRISYQPLQIKVVDNDRRMELATYVFKQFPANKSSVGGFLVDIHNIDPEDPKSKRLKWLKEKYPWTRRRRSPAFHKLCRLELLASLSRSDMTLLVGVTRDNSSRLKLNAPQRALASEDHARLDYCDISNASV